MACFRCLPTAHRAFAAGRLAKTGMDTRHVGRRPKAFEYWHAGMWQYNRDRWYNKSLGKPAVQRMTCRLAYNASACPAHSAIPSAQGRSGMPWPRATAGGLMFFSMSFGHLTNCHMVLNFARWLAELMGKTVVIPLCADGDGCYERLRYTNLTTVWQPSSFGSCSSPHGSAGSIAMPARGTHSATCIGLSAEQCAYEVAVDPKLSRALVLSGFAHYALPTLAAASLNRECAGNGTCDWPSLVVSEECRRLMASGACESQTSRNHTSMNALLRRLKASDACPRACAEHVYPDVPAGNVYVADLFWLAMGLRDSWRLCRKPVLTERPRTQAAALRAALPDRFVCMHWRAGDMLLKKRSSAAAALANASKLATALQTAASAVGASEALVLSNANAESARSVAAELRGKLTLRTARCSDTPADAEKTVCAGASALLLSRRSTFSTHILKLAGAGTRYSFLGRCPLSNVTGWLACSQVVS